MQFNANGIGNKLTELGEFLKRHNVRVTVVQESKLTSNSKTPSMHPELHHSTKGPSSKTRRWFTHLDSQVDKLLPEA